ncbi:MAG: SDR family NAD(P)-dependent oxidoreductase [Methanomicrobiales archaeon]|nr:SDR family NAD(P)-dependent oxidoreductase [Methanomicrobiales archaeon]MDI6876493.1 SDR family NAD(P)-dependent oxidoreductase [Methanomicrobiales archaeon]
MDWNDKRVLVTGAGGFIGSHLTEHLVELGASVRAFVRYNSRNDRGLLEMLTPQQIDRVEVVMGDLRDADAVRAAVKGVETIFHLGSLIAIPYSYLHPRETIETNVMGAVNVLQAAREYGVERVIHTSTSEVYGTARYVPIDEEHPLQGQSPYSASKIAADKIAESFHRSFGLPVATIRPFNTYGPRQSARAVIPAIITQALCRDSIDLGATHTTRDYTYVTDTVRGFIAVAESARTIGETINIGSNYEIAIGDIARKVASLLGREIEIRIDPARLRPRESEVERLWCDNTRAREMLGWSPLMPLDTGLEETIKWIAGRTNLYKVGQYAV